MTMTPTGGPSSMPRFTPPRAHIGNDIGHHFTLQLVYAPELDSASCAPVRTYPLSASLTTLSSLWCLLRDLCLLPARQQLAPTASPSAQLPIIQGATKSVLYRIVAVRSQRHSLRDLVRLLITPLLLLNTTFPVFRAQQCAR